MGDSDSTIDHNLQEPEAVDTLSLADFPITQDHGGSSNIQDNRNPPSSSATDDFFEFFSGGFSDYSDESMMSHAEDIIFCGKLVPINEQQRHPKNPPEKKEKNLRRNQHNQYNGRRRSESMSEVKSTTMSPFIRNSRSLDYKKLRRNSIMSSEPAPEIRRDGSSKKCSSSRWRVLLYGLVKVPPSEMDLRDMKSRLVRRTSSKTHYHSSESGSAVPVSRSDDDRKCSSRVLGFLSCKSSASATVTTPLRYMPKV